MYISKEQYEKLKQELEKLETEERKKIAERLKIAKEFGDLTENAEYEEALEAKERLEVQISEIKRILRTAKIIKNAKKSNDRIYPETTFEVLEKNSKRKVVFTLVGYGEANFKEGKISTESPLGQAFLNKKTGDIVEVQTPQGKVIYEIRKIYEK